MRLHMAFRNYCQQWKSKLCSPCRFKKCLTSFKTGIFPFFSRLMIDANFFIMIKIQYGSNMKKTIIFCFSLITIMLLSGYVCAR